MRNARTNIAGNTARPTMNAVELGGYAMYVLMQCQLAGCLTFDGHRPTPEETALRGEARKTADRLGRALVVCRAGEVAGLLDSYDMLYRIGYDDVAPQDFIHRQQDRVFQAWLGGDAAIEESVVVRMLRTRAIVSRGTLSAEQAEVCERLFARWIETLKRYSRFPDATAFENYQRLAIVMASRLKDEDADGLKHRCYERNRIDDFGTTGTALLESYRLFLNRLGSSLLTPAEQLAADNRLLQELITRPDLPLNHRKAYEVALECNRKGADS